jgi:AraC-like protein
MPRGSARCAAHPGRGAAVNDGFRLGGEAGAGAGGETLYSDAGCTSVHSPDDDLGTQWSADCRMMGVRIGRKALERDARADAAQSV